MTTPSVAGLSVDTMQPDVEPSVPAYIDQTSTGRAGTDSILDAYRAEVQQIETAVVLEDYAAALALRTLYRQQQNTSATIVDSSGSTYEGVHIRRVIARAFEQADGSGMVRATWHIRVASTPPPEPAE